MPIRHLEPRDRPGAAIAADPTGRRPAAGPHRAIHAPDLAAPFLPCSDLPAGGDRPEPAAAIFGAVHARIVARPADTDGAAAPRPAVLGAAT